LNNLGGTEATWEMNCHKDSHADQQSFELVLKRLYFQEDPVKEAENLKGFTALAAYLGLFDFQSLIENNLEGVLNDSTLIEYIAFAFDGKYGALGDPIRDRCRDYLCKRGSSLTEDIWHQVPKALFKDVLSGDDIFIVSEWDRCQLLIDLYKSASSLNLDSRLSLYQHLLNRVRFSNFTAWQLMSLKAMKDNSGGDLIKREVLYFACWNQMVLRDLILTTKENYLGTAGQPLDNGKICNGFGDKKPVIDFEKLVNHGEEPVADRGKPVTDGEKNQVLMAENQLPDGENRDANGGRTPAHGETLAAAANGEQSAADGEKTVSDLGDKHATVYEMSICDKTLRTCFEPFRFAVCLDTDTSPKFPFRESKSVFYGGAMWKISVLHYFQELGISLIRSTGSGEYVDLRSEARVACAIHILRSIKEGPVYASREIGFSADSNQYDYKLKNWDKTNEKLSVCVSILML
jgi:hypothetical protein